MFSNTLRNRTEHDDNIATSGENFKKFGTSDYTHTLNIGSEDGRSSAGPVEDITMYEA